MNENDTKAERKGPDYTAYTVREWGPGKSAWDRVGAGFEHRDGQGIDVVLNSMPLDGRITLREAQKEEFKTQRNEEVAQAQSQAQTQSQAPAQAQPQERSR